MKALFFILSLSLFIIAGTADALACTCVPPSSDPVDVQITRAKANADAVFVGKLVKIVRPNTITGQIIAQFEIERSWSDHATSKISIYTAWGTAMCGFPFQKGMRYIVYASGDERLQTTICTRTALLVDDWSPDERYLGIPFLYEKGKKIS
jgi:hypothetical protein